jgi:hypothetical protein
LYSIAGYGSKRPCFVGDRAENVNGS